MVLRRDTIHHTAAEERSDDLFFFGETRNSLLQPREDGVSVLVGLFSTDEERPNGRIREVLPFVFSADTNEHDD